MAKKYLRGGVWYVRYQSAGHTYKFSTKTGNEKAAEKVRSKTEVDIAEGRFLDKKTLSTLQLRPFADDLYLPRMKAAKPRSYDWRRDRVNQLCKVLGPDFPLESADDAAADSYVEARTGKVSLRTIREDLAVLKHCLTMAWKWRRETLISEWKLRDWHPPELTDQDDEPEPVDPEDWKKILTVCRNKARSGRWEEVHGIAVVLLARTLGARRGEVLRLRKEDVDLETGIVRRQVLKKRKVEYVETRIEYEPLEWLRKVAGSHDWPLIFCNPKTGRLRRDNKRYWTTVRKDAKVSTKFHSIRHSYGRDFLEAGGSMRELQARLGHSSIRTTEKYAHLAKRKEPPKGLPIE